MSWGREIPSRALLVMLPVLQTATDTEEIELYLGESPPGHTASLFAPGVVSTGRREHSAPTFTPAGDEIYWSVFIDDSRPELIMTMACRDGVWSAPAPASFSRRFGNGGPRVSPDGKQLVFHSDRPHQGRTEARRDYDLWVMERGGDGWQVPRPLPSPVNSPAHDFSGCLTEDGTLYFTTAREEQLRAHEVYRALPGDGGYTKTDSLGEPVNSTGYDSYAFVDPGRNVLLLSVSGRTDGFGAGDLCAAFRSPEGTWSEPVNLGSEVNTGWDERFPALSPDGRYLFFVSNRRIAGAGPEDPGNGLDDVYWVDAGVITAARAELEAPGPAQR